ncbi:MAG: phage tail tape measure protein [Marinomonas foliarum]|uniref:phage tail tape measure protein n=1 Tax=Marinomonas foliarum TaxID=491950 RepID=UPI003F97BB36
MSDLQTSLVVNLAGNLAQRAQKYARSMEQMSERGQRSMRLLNRSASVVGKGLDKLGNRYTTLITGAGLTLAGRQVMGLETRFERLGIQANKSKAEMDALKQTIFDVAQEKEIRVDPSQITAAIEAIVEKTGDLEFAKNNIRNIGMAIQATGADGGSIGEILAEFQKMGMIDPSNILETLDILNVQGKEGAFTLQNIAALGPRVITAYTATGRTGTQAMREMGAALQMIRMGTGSSEMAATAFEATMRTLTDPAKLKVLEASGLKIFDPEAAKEGLRVLRPINEIMAEIIQKVNGDATRLGVVFDAEAIRAFNAAASEFQRTGSLATLEKFMNVQADGTTTMRDSARAAATSEAALQNLLTAWQQFQNNQLAGPIQSTADALNSLEPNAVQRWLEIGGYIAAVGLGFVAIRKGAGLLGKVGDVYSGGKSKGIGGAISSMGAQRVFVVNMPGMGMGGSASSNKTTTVGSSSSKPARKGSLSYTSPVKAPQPSKWSKFGKFAGKFGGAPLAIAGGGLALASTLSSDASTQEKVVDSAGIAGGMGGSALGGWGGAVAGAAIGSVVPVIGTAVGAAVGGLLGSMGGYFAGDAAGSSIAEQLASYFSDDKKDKESEKLTQQPVQAEMKITLDSNGQLKATSVKSSSNLNLDIAGNSMAMAGL